MSGFKLLAIRPLIGCDRRLLNNLKAGIIYKFYQNYLFNDKNGKEISVLNNNLSEIDVEITTTEKLIDIYTSGDIHINISAVVGENGSGKSSIVDFNNIISYYLACNHFKTMNSSVQNAFTNIQNLLVLTVEYITELVPFLDNKIDIKKEDIFKLKEHDLADNVAIIKNYLNAFFIQYTLKEKVINIEKFHDLLIRYNYEGNEYHDLNGQFSFIESRSMLIALNNSFLNKIDFLVKDYNREFEFNQTLKNNFNFQLFYLKGDRFFCTQKINDLTIVPDDDFFYSVILNYSLHSLNSNTMGSWIFNLFHKNDGYQTPVVINPYRKDGIININNELKLSIDRLTYNIIDQLNYKEEASILSKYKFSKLLLKRKVHDRDRFPFSQIQNDLKLQSDFLDFISSNPLHFQFYNEEKNILDYTLGYLIKKFRKIARTYTLHFYNYEGSLDADLLENVESLENWQLQKTKDIINSNKNTHITKKFFQTYNFLKNYELYKEKLDFLKSWDLDQEINVSSTQILEWIAVIKNDILDNGVNNGTIDTADIFVNLFPNIFDVDIEFLVDDEPIKLSKLSSGEQQYIFNINTITYHLNNLKSITESKEVDSKLRSYKHVNIILDEIELYYHPQFQKNFIKDVVDSIKGISYLKDLKNFNIILLTHSPFILSDIVSSNILRLKGGIPKSIKASNTFGANIHDLLANDFFLQNGFMGDFAHEYITNLIDEINNIDTKISNDTFRDYLRRVEIIDEPFIKYKLIEMLENRKHSGDFDLEYLIEKKQTELDALKKKKDND